MNPTSKEWLLKKFKEGYVDYSKTTASPVKHQLPTTAKTLKPIIHLPNNKERSISRPKVLRQHTDTPELSRAKTPTKYGPLRTLSKDVRVIESSSRKREAVSKSLTSSMLKELKSRPTSPDSKTKTPVKFEIIKKKKLRDEPGEDATIKTNDQTPNSLNDSRVGEFFTSNPF